MGDGVSLRNIARARERTSVRPSFPGISHRDLYLCDVSLYCVTIGKDSGEMYERCAQTVTEARKGDRRSSEGSVQGEGGGMTRGGGRVELSEAETSWDGPHPSPRSRRPPRL